MSDIDPITLSVLAGRMEQIADEMDATLFRAAFNPIIAEAHDASHGLYHAGPGTRWSRENPVFRFLSV
jgi:N-methylhydantoinase B